MARVTEKSNEDTYTLCITRMRTVAITGVGGTEVRQTSQVICATDTSLQSHV